MASQFSVDGALLHVALFVSSAAASLALAVRGATDAAAVAAADCPMHRVLINKHSDLAIATAIATVAAPVLALAEMFHESAMWGAYSSFGGLIFLIKRVIAITTFRG